MEAIASSQNIDCTVELDFSFGFSPVPDITWTYSNKGKIHKISNFDTELEITNVSFADDGLYTCTAKNGNGKMNHTTRFLVKGTNYETNLMRLQFKSTGWSGPLVLARRGRGIYAKW